MSGGAIVTGGGYGLGAAIASELAREGYRVAIVGRNADRLQQTLKDIRSLGQCEVFVCDASDWDQVQRATEQIAGVFDGIQVLVNNAGGWSGEAIETGDPLKLRTLIESMLMSTIYFSKAVVPFMRATGGHIINIGSTSGLPGSRDSAIASAPKAAVRQFTHTFAREVAKHRIRVSVIHPARMSKSATAEDVIAKRDSTGLWTNLAPSQVASIVGFVLRQPPNLLIREIVVGPFSAEQL
jgi:meso-butanediol dehydrogenase/(S,S)-butanediol dehydrogenase/diacetyl reductase